MNNYKDIVLKKKTNKISIDLYCAYASIALRLKHQQNFFIIERFMLTEVEAVQAVLAELGAHREHPDVNVYLPHAWQSQDV